MFLNILLGLLTVLGTGIYLLAPGSLWVIGAGLVFFSWLVYLLFFIPRKKPQTRGWWLLAASFIIFAVIVGVALLLYWQNNPFKIVITMTNPTLNIEAEQIAKPLSLLVGAFTSVVLTLLFLFIIGYFSVVYILDLPHEEDLGFWTAFRSFVSLIFNIQYNWLIVEEGKITEIKEKGFLKTWLSLGKVIIRPGHAVVFQKGGKITRICGAGVVPTSRNEFIRGEPIDLGPQFHVDTLKNVITADRIPLEIEVGIGYKIKPQIPTNGNGIDVQKSFLQSFWTGIRRLRDFFPHPPIPAETFLEDHNNSKPKIITDNLNLFPVAEKTLFDAAFKVKNWHTFAQGAIKNNLRDLIMTYKVDDLFILSEKKNKPEEKKDEPRANRRLISEIETTAKNTINETAANNGVEITGVDIRQIILPEDIREAIKMRIKAQAEAEAIHRIEQSRNTARGNLVASLLSNISSHTNKEIGDLELQLAAVFAQLTRRGVIDDVLGHEYMEVLKALAASNGTNIFNATPGAPTIEAESILPELMRSGH